mgnify:CR=1 FL=1
MTHPYPRSRPVHRVIGEFQTWFLTDGRRLPGLSGAVGGQRAWSAQPNSLETLPQGRPWSAGYQLWLNGEPRWPLCTVPSYEHFTSAVRSEALWLLSFAGFHYAPPHHNSVVLHTSESSGRAFDRQCKQVKFSCHQSSLPQWGM